MTVPPLSASRDNLTAGHSGNFCYTADSVSVVALRIQDLFLPGSGLSLFFRSELCFNSTRRDEEPQVCLSAVRLLRWSVFKGLRSWLGLELWQWVSTEDFFFFTASLNLFDCKKAAGNSPLALWEKWSVICEYRRFQVFSFMVNDQKHK